LLISGSECPTCEKKLVGSVVLLKLPDESAVHVLDAMTLVHDDVTPLRRSADQTKALAGGSGSSNSEAWVRGRQNSLRITNCSTTVQLHTSYQMLSPHSQDTTKQSPWLAFASQRLDTQAWFFSKQESKLRVPKFL